MNLAPAVMIQHKTKPDKRLGQQTITFPNKPAIVAVAAIAGPMEGRGPLGPFYDEVTRDTLLGQKSWEQAEVKLMEKAINTAVKKAGLQPGEIDAVICGDLLNQLTASSFAARTLDRPHLGIYGACSSWAEAMILGALMVDGGYAGRVVIGASSHHDSAERQFRYPTEFGAQRPPTATWTVTGAGAACIADKNEAKGSAAPVITHGTIGRVIDIGVKDPYDLGSAMAPAAVDTIVTHLRDTNRIPSDYDLIITGDLGWLGRTLATELAMEIGFNLEPVFDDCGLHIYHPSQDVHCGASGCASSALMYTAVLHRRLMSGEIKRLLLVATGALFSTTTYQQGESIPSIAYAVAIEGPAATGEGVD